MLKEHLKMAWSSIRGAKARSLLTMFGIIIGVSSVVTVISLGDGLKRQISGQAAKIGGELRIIQPVQRQLTTGKCSPSRRGKISFPSRSCQWCSQLR
jgi:putative ABC transport system permease protein